MSIIIGISLLLLGWYVSLMLFYYWGWLKTRSFKADPHFSPKTKVSVIIAARNEEEKIGNCVRSILNQDYPPELYEIILVDDHSEDNTMKAFLNVAPSLRDPITGQKADELERSNPLSQSNKRIASTRLVALSMAVESRNDAKLLSFKKQAISKGIAAAQGELIITTDADCIAESGWIKNMVNYYEKNEPVMIAGPVAFTGEKSWLEKWQSLDMCGMMVITAGAITNGFPNMCNGANLAYQKQAFLDVNGFEGVDNHPSGDDVMLMMKLSKKFPGGVHFLKSEDAIVYTQPEKNLSSLFQQRLRWLSKATAFPDWKVSAVMVLSYVFNLSIVVNLIAGIFWMHFLWTGLIALVVKSVVEFLILYSGCRFFKKENLMRLFLPAEVFHILYVLIVGGASWVTGFGWKGRRY